MLSLDLVRNAPRLDWNRSSLLLVVNQTCYLASTREYIRKTMASLWQVYLRMGNALHAPDEKADKDWQNLIPSALLGLTPWPISIIQFRIKMEAAKHAHHRVSAPRSIQTTSNHQLSTRRRKIRNRKDSTISRLPRLGEILRWLQQRLGMGDGTPLNIVCWRICSGTRKKCPWDSLTSAIWDSLVSH